MRDVQPITKSPGENFVMHCPLAGQNAAITWKKGTHILGGDSLASFSEFYPRLSTDGKSLIFQSLSARSQGDYECIASYRNGSVKSVLIPLTIEQKPDDVYVVMGLVIFAGMFAAVLSCAFCAGWCCKRRQSARKAAIPRGKLSQEALLPPSHPEAGQDSRADIEKLERHFIDRLGRAAGAIGVSSFHAFQQLLCEREIELGPDALVIKYPRETLGSGHFSVVFAATLTTTGCTVAAKVPKDTYNVEQYVAIIAEAKALCATKGHRYILGLEGLCIANIGQGDIVLATEYCELGSLKHYLTKLAKTCVDDLQSESNPPMLLDVTTISSFSRRSGEQQSITTSSLVRVAYQVAEGMRYVHAKGILHRDLAARNILLSFENGQIVPKIADFGMSRFQAEYRITGKNAPKKWLAPELFHDYAVYSRPSDVWSFGVLLWELFALGEEPYDEQLARTDSPGVESFVLQGGRLEIPTRAPQGTWNLMNDCWLHEALKRPSFEEIVRRLYTVCNNFGITMPLMVLDTRITCESVLEASEYAEVIRRY